jgi:pimeloyl-ACP methyl ester carboxylesterase
MQPQTPYFREAGSGTSVVCIHSSASSSGQWRALMERLAGQFRVIAVDLYGSDTGASRNQALPYPMQSLQVELVFRLDRHEAHVLALYRSRTLLCSGGNRL